MSRLTHLGGIKINKKEVARQPGVKCDDKVLKCQARRCKHNVDKICQLPCLIIGKDGKCEFYKIDRFLGDTSSDIY